MRHFIASLVAVLVITLLPTEADASQILFDRAPACGWGPNFCSPPYPVTNGLPTAIPDGSPSAFYGQYYSRFVVTEDSLVDSVMWLAVGSASTITFYATGGPVSSSRDPGTTLTSYGLNAANTTGPLVGYGWPDTGTQVHLFTTTLATPFYAVGGTQYWLSINSDGWARNGGQSGYCASCGPFGEIGGYGSANFQLSGITAIPEPTSLVLLVSGLSGAVAARMRTRAQRRRRAGASSSW